MKLHLRIIVGIFYLAALMLSLVISIKPGSSIFYKKVSVQPELLAPVEDSFEYTFGINKTIFDLNTILVLEDGQVIIPTSMNQSPPDGNGSPLLSWVGHLRVSIVFTPGENPEQAITQHTYQIGIRPVFITRQWGLTGFTLLIAGFLAFLTLAWRDPYKKPEQLFGSPSYAVNTWKKRYAVAIDSTREFVTLHRYHIGQAAASTFLLAFFYVFMEWMFFVTKPSFMDIFTLGEKIQTLLLTGFALSLLALAALMVFLALDVLITPIFPAYRKYAPHLPVAFLAAGLALILVDNFTYTVFKFGIATTTTPMQVIYALIFLLLLIALLRKLAFAFGPPSRARIWLLAAVTGLSAVSLVLAVLAFEPEYRVSASGGSEANLKNRPNIIFLSSDGLNAANLSAYGYERDTTPFLRELANTSLLSQNNFANAGASLGTETAVLTGKSPYTTRVLYSPDILRGVDSYQHLPGLLKKHGYRTVSLGVQFYVDPNTINFQNAFDAVNCQENNPDDLLHRLSDYGFDNPVYFLSTLQGRILDRLKHIYFIEEMENPYDLVTKIEPHYLNDDERMNCLIAYLNDSHRTGQPLFAHVHLMGTHGGKFDPPKQVFSKGKIQSDSWMTDFYDDAILAFDTSVQQLVQHLQNNGQYENTLLFIYTDHGQRYINTNRTPLIIHFPNDQHSGSIDVNTQSIDLAPTVLDYLGLDQPAWMDGSSLLGDLEADRIILIGNVVATEFDSLGFAVVPEDYRKPPFYQFGKLTTIQCQKYYEVYLQDLTMHQGEVEGYVNPCPESNLDSKDVVWEKVGQFLTERGFELPPEW